MKSLLLMIVALVSGLGAMVFILYGCAANEMWSLIVAMCCSAVCIVANVTNKYFFDVE